MKNLTSQLKDHYAQETTTLATCWKCTLKNGQVYGFTTHTKDLTIDGVLYESASGYVPTSVESDSSLSVDNLEVEAILNSDTISEADLLAGLWDYAKVEIFEVNYNDLSMGTNPLRKGRIGEVVIKDVSFVAELRGLGQAFTQGVGELYSPNCRASLGDARCKVNIASYTVSGSATSVTNARIFTDSSRVEADDYFNGGMLTWTGGDNAGYSMEVKDFTNSSKIVELVLAMPYAIQVGDTYTMHRGCNKAFSTCREVFGNVVNFRGEPHLPGLDRILTPKR